MSSTAAKKPGYFRDIYRNRKLIAGLSKNDFKTKYAGSFFGIIWAFVQPTITIVVYWFVFSKGLRSPGVEGYPFILWLMAGLVPWFYFSEALNGGTNALIEYNYLVKKVVFNIDILPIVKIISSIFVHIFFTAIVFMLCWFYGYKPDLYSIQIIYYIFCMFVMLLGISYLTSAIVCFFKDLTQIINIILQIGVWLTPIMWDISMLQSTTVRRIFKLNPVYYIVDGFRDALLYKRWITDKLLWTTYFWVFTILMFVLGRKVFGKLKVHFADVL
ncbi:MAG: ABC transporter permease [Lachnospiraceae bacterium]|nr:ABC transporter permease [Lachnospiraceae bacterium]